VSQRNSIGGERLQIVDGSMTYSQHLCLLKDSGFYPFPYCGCRFGFCNLKSRICYPPLHERVMAQATGTGAMLYFQQPDGFVPAFSLSGLEPA
jgi:hypothetical protein